MSIEQFRYKPRGIFAHHRSNTFAAGQVKRQVTPVDA
jgi:hypothetical protein